MKHSKRYYLTIDCNGTEDEIMIHSPEGRSLAFIWLWDEADIPEARQKKRDARLIVNALNAFQKPGSRA